MQAETSAPVQAAIPALVQTVLADSQLSYGYAQQATSNALNGDAGNNRVDGDGGHNRLYGNSGNDRLYG